MKLSDIVEFAKCFSNESRLKLIKLLAERELCVCELEEVTGQTQSNISQHLRILFNADLVEKRREGQLIYYSLNKVKFEEKIKELEELISLPLERMADFKEEWLRFQNLRKNERIKKCKACQRR
ncbi:hypothetical protein BBF96_07200 [Anoxybacter fermentans]|uniref:HTH arsR-type domain-containing protein n=1 Tax=Anoxybacter fermentans TaxID=1323375 RepID=A0A3S9SY61_9FIRM|nr:metalloregulator ArsR/SmtB family transcription factor [Anoxybacter fermentans]AZR73190.1 hypothetical protein BBF96_07200 [Anoxybacter fermentans]